MKNNYTTKDLLKLIYSHPKFEHVKGSYALHTKGKDTFFCDEDEFQIFISQILNAAITLSVVPANKAPKEWAALPGRNKDNIRKRMEEAPHVYQDVLKSGDEIVTISKMSDEGRAFDWHA